MSIIFYTRKFGFQKYFSTAHTITNIEKSLDNKQSVCAAFIDLQKAFDTVHHKILLNKLSHYRIKDTANNWFSSYLAKRNQFVTIHGFYSDLRNVPTQGASRISSRPPPFSTIYQ